MRPSAIKAQYGAIEAKASIEEKSPEQLTLMLLDRACSSIRGCLMCLETLENEDLIWEDKIPQIESYHQNAGKALQIVTLLKETLDYERGGDLAKQLSETYSAILRSLYKATREKNQFDMDKILRAASELREAWQGVVGQSEPAPL